MILLAVTPGEGFDPARWRPVLDSGIDALLIREPQLDFLSLGAAAMWCLNQRPGVKIWVRGLEVPGCGLHLPERADVPADSSAALSRPLHEESQWEARRRAEQLLISPIFPSPGKGTAWGPARLRHFLDSLPEGGPRLLALGGVTPENTARIRHPRLAGIAAIRPFWAGDAAGAVAAFRGAWG